MPPRRAREGWGTQFLLVVVPLHLLVPFHEVLHVVADLVVTDSLQRRQSKSEHGTHTANPVPCSAKKTNPPKGILQNWRVAIHPLTSPGVGLRGLFGWLFRDLKFGVQNVLGSTRRKLRGFPSLGYPLGLTNPREGEGCEAETNPPTQPLPAWVTNLKIP